MSFTATQAPAHARVDVRPIAPAQRHPLIFGTFHSLAPGQWLELVNDHDPSPLRHQFEAKVPGAYDWRYLQTGPDLWRVSITKTTAVEESDGGSSCCGGGCGGGRA